MHEKRRNLIRALAPAPLIRLARASCRATMPPVADGDPAGATDACPAACSCAAGAACDPDCPVCSDTTRTMSGHFAVFNQWTQIDSFFEGTFMERFVTGAFTKTLAETKQKVLFQHGRDAMTGMKPLGTPTVVREDAEGAYYEVPLFDTEYVRELLPGLEAGVYGASFQFDAIREEWDQRPKPSATNPAGLPERTVVEARCPEFGPVTFPAYADATAGLMRSLTDQFRLEEISADPAQMRAYQSWTKSKHAIAPAPLAAARTRTASTRAAISREDFIAQLRNSRRV